MGSLACVYQISLGQFLGSVAWVQLRPSKTGIFISFSYIAMWVKVGSTASMKLCNMMTHHYINMGCNQSRLFGRECIVLNSAFGT